MKYAFPLTLLSFAIVPNALAASGSYVSLQKNLQTVSPLLQQDVDQLHQEDNDAQEIEAKDLFPLSDSGATDQRPSVQPGQKNLTVVIGTASVTFSDVPLVSWFAPYVREAAERGIVSGYKDANGNYLGIYGPERNVSVEELAKMAVKAALIVESSCGTTVKNPGAQTSWSRPYITCAEQANWSIYNDENLRITRPATRAEVIATLMDAFKIEYSDRIVAGSVFKDVKDSTRFASAIEKAIVDGIVSGYTNPDGSRTGYFGPNNPVTRAEVAKMITMVIQKYSQ